MKVTFSQFGGVLIVFLCLGALPSRSEEDSKEKKEDEKRSEFATEFGAQLTDDEIKTVDEKGEKSEEALTAEALKTDPSEPIDDVKFNPPEYRILERQGELELRTPYGDYTVRGRFGPKGLPHYKFAIPLEAIKPKETPEEPEAEPKQAPEVAEVKDPPREVAAVDPKWVHSPQNVDMLIVEANRLFNQKRFYESLTVVESILRQDPNFVRAWIMKGSLLHVQGHKEMAKKAWEQALTLRPNDPEIIAIMQRYQ